MTAATPNTVKARNRTIHATDAAIAVVILSAALQFFQPGIANLLRIHAAISGESIETLVERFAGENRYGALKTEVAEVVASVQGPFRERYLEFMADRGELDRILADGAARAREIAALAAEVARIGA